MTGNGNGIRFTVRAGDLGTWVLVIISSLGIMGTVLWSYFNLTERLSTVETKVSSLEKAVYELQQQRSGHK